MFSKLTNVLSVKKIINQPLNENNESTKKLIDDIAFNDDLFKYIDTVKGVQPIDKGYILHEKIVSEINEYDKLRKLVDEINSMDLKK